MIPDVKLLSEESIDRILGEAHQLLLQTGVRVSDPEARALLEKAGAKIENGVAFIPEPIITRLLSTVGNDFSLHNRDGDPAVHFSPGNDVCFDPGSCAVNILDPDTGQHRPALTADLVRLVQVTEMLP